jgi:hypothetical protein
MHFAEHALLALWDLLIAVHELLALRDLLIGTSPWDQDG